MTIRVFALPYAPFLLFHFVVSFMHRFVLFFCHFSITYALTIDIVKLAWFIMVYVNIFFIHN